MVTLPAAGLHRLQERRLARAHHRAQGPGQRRGVLPRLLPSLPPARPRELTAPRPPSHRRSAQTSQSTSRRRHSSRRRRGRSCSPVTTCARRRSGSRRGGSSGRAESRVHLGLVMERVLRAGRAFESCSDPGRAAMRARERPTPPRPLLSAELCERSLERPADPSPSSSTRLDRSTERCRDERARGTAARGHVPPPRPPSRPQSRASSLTVPCEAGRSSSARLGMSIQRSSARQKRSRGVQSESPFLVLLAEHRVEPLPRSGLPRCVGRRALVSMGGTSDAEPARERPIRENARSSSSTLFSREDDAAHALAGPCRARLSLSRRHREW